MIGASVLFCNSVQVYGMQMFSTYLSPILMQLRVYAIMGKITVFTLDDCSNCHKIKQILEAKGAAFTEISLTKTPEWRSLLFLLANGKLVMSEYTHHLTCIHVSVELPR